MLMLNGIEYVNEKEASKKYGYSTHWFTRCRYEKKGPPFKKMDMNGRVLYSLKELESWFSENLRVG